MSILNQAKMFALAGLLALCMGVGVQTSEAEARGYSKQSTRSATHHVKRKYRHASRSRKAKRYAAAKSRKMRQASAHRSQRVRKASYRRHHRMGLGATSAARSHSMHRRSHSGGGVSWSAPSGCLDSSLRSVIHQVASQFGSLRVNSTCRSRSHNARVGGASKSHHIGGNAVDFRVFGNVGAVASFLRSHGSVGGYKHYGGGLFHIDTGPRRSW